MSWRLEKKKTLKPTRKTSKDSHPQEEKTGCSVSKDEWNARLGFDLWEEFLAVTKLWNTFILQKSVLALTTFYPYILNNINILKLSSSSRKWPSCPWFKGFLKFKAILFCALWLNYGLLMTEEWKITTATLTHTVPDRGSAKSERMWWSM